MLWEGLLSLALQIFSVLLLQKTQRNSLTFKSLALSILLGSRTALRKSILVSSFFNVVDRSIQDCSVICSVRFAHDAISSAGPPSFFKANANCKLFSLWCAPHTTVIMRWSKIELLRRKSTQWNLIVFYMPFDIQRSHPRKNDELNEHPLLAINKVSSFLKSLQLLFASTLKTCSHELCWSASRFVNCFQ